MRKFFILVTLVISSLAYGRDSWKVCFLNIFHDGKNTSDIISRAVKSSVSGFLKRDFILIEVTNEATNGQGVLSKNDVYLLALSNNAEFAIFGYVSQQGQKMKLVLRLIDVANKSIKLSKSYDFYYDVDEIFNTIDTIVVDFTEGIKKVVPKYEEKVVVEYREKIKQKLTQLEIPGTFIPSVYLSMYITSPGNYTILSVYPEVSIKYLTTKGSLFNKGWFIGLNSILSLNAVNYASTNLEYLESNPLGTRIDIYSGINLVEWLGLGMDMIFHKDVIIPQVDVNSIYGSSVNMALTPMLRSSFGSLDIQVLFFTINKDFQSLIILGDLKYMNYSDFSLTYIEVRPLFRVSETLNIEGKLGFEIVGFQRELGGRIKNIKLINILVGMSIARSFSF